MKKTMKTFLACLLVCAMVGGCVSIPNSETVSPRYFKNKGQGGGPRSEMEQINFVKLRMDKPAEELLGPNDVLGIYIAGITGNPEEAPPIHNIGSATERPASGYPYMVRSDGTLSLPMLPEPILRSLTLDAALVAKLAVSRPPRLWMPPPSVLPTRSARWSRASWATS